MSIPSPAAAPIERPEQLAEYLGRLQAARGLAHRHRAREVRLLRDTLKPLPYEGERSVRAMLEGLRDALAGRRLRRRQHHRAGKGRRECQPGTRRAAGAVGRAAGDDPPDLRRGERAPARGARGRRPDRRGLHRAGRRPDLAARRHADDAQGALPADDRLHGPGRHHGQIHDVPDLHGAGEPRFRVRGRHGARRCAWRSRCSRWPPRFSPIRPFSTGKPNGHKSWRSRVWRDLDADRTGMLPFVFEDGFGFEAWVGLRARCADVFRLPRRQVYRRAGPVLPRFPEGGAAGAAGRGADARDWADHLTTIFPEARIKKFIEMRGADGGPWRRLCALPAFWVGLMYDQGALDAAWDLVKGWDAETREALRVAASATRCRQGGRHPHARAGARGAGISEAGLKARARPGAGGMVPDETHFLQRAEGQRRDGQGARRRVAGEILVGWRLERRSESGSTPTLYS
jgi:glutamate--cysteine ligase